MAASLRGVLTAVLALELAPGVACLSSRLVVGPPRPFVALSVASTSPRIPDVSLTATEPQKVPVEVDDTTKSMIIGLLGQMEKVEQVVEEDNLSKIGPSEFQTLLTKLDLTCSEKDAQKIFQLIDTEGTGSIAVTGMKSKLRESGIVNTMYADSLQSFGKVLAATVVFAAGIGVFKSPADALDFVTGYAVEDSLSVDNLFVFLLIFRAFKVPAQLQMICLKYGIAGAVVLRAICIFAGLAAVNSFEPILLGFSAFLIYSSYSLLGIGGDDDDDDEEDAPPEWITNAVAKLPTTGTFDGDKLIVAKEGGGFLATNLLLTLLTIEFSDLVFAVDSIPAVFAVTNDPFIVYTSNIFAITGLRSLYQILAIAVGDLEYLEKGVALVLGFVGVKLGLEVFGVNVDSLLSLSVVLSLLGGSVALSLLNKDDDDDDASR